MAGRQRSGAGFDRAISSTSCLPERGCRSAACNMVCYSCYLDICVLLTSLRFCVDADVSRIEEADKRTFETIAQYSNHVPVFVIGTKKDKLVGYRKMQLFEQYMAKSTDYQEALRLANLEADKAAEEQFLALKDQLSQIKSYKADGYICLSKG